MVGIFIFLILILADLKLLSFSVTITLSTIPEDPNLINLPSTSLPDILEIIISSSVINSPSFTNPLSSNLS